jgi:hypothetical protein
VAEEANGGQGGEVHRHLPRARASSTSDSTSSSRSTGDGGS